MQPVKPYKKGAEYSYSLGAFPTFELLKTRPDCVTQVYVHSSFTDRAALDSICNAHHIPVVESDKTIQKLSDKENVFVIGVFNKFSDTLDPNSSHLVFVNPGNMGNLGTNLRTAVGFGIKDIAVIEPGADLFNPKTVRSSMGAIFRIRHQSFASFADYKKLYPDHEIFTFMLDGEKPLTVNDCPKPKLFSLVFGNEATGLPKEYLQEGTSIIIPQSKEVDSLNLTIAVGVGTYMFTH